MPMFNKAVMRQTWQSMFDQAVNACPLTIDDLRAEARANGRRITSDHTAREDTYRADHHCTPQQLEDEVVLRRTANTVCRRHEIATLVQAANPAIGKSVNYLISSDAMDTVAGRWPELAEARTFVAEMGQTLHQEKIHACAMSRLLTHLFHVGQVLDVDGHQAMVVTLANTSAQVRMLNGPRATKLSQHQLWKLYEDNTTRLDQAPEGYSRPDTATQEN